MIALRLFFIAVIVSTFAAVVVQWHYSLGFNAADPAWWRWLIKAALSPQYRESLVYPIWWTGGAMLALMLVGGWFFARPGSRTISGSADARFTHGSARWAKWRDVVRAELDGNRGVVVGGWKKPLSIRPLRHDGPEHILAFAPNDEVRRGASRMRKRAHNERSGVHSSASVPLALFSDPIVAANIAASDFCIADLVNPGRAASLYIVIPPSDILRLRPLIRIMVNQYLTRLTADLPKPGERRRLLLMLDEFTSIGKLEIFEKALAFMAGYGLKAYIIVQDLTQLQKEYGKEESISSNCHVRIAYAPNKLETGKVLSDMTGKTTLVQSRRSRSWGGRGGGNVSDSIAEVARPLMTADEVMSLPGIRKGWFGRIIPGHMLIFVAGQPPIYGRQWIYLNSRDYRRRAALQPPKMVSAGLQPANISAGEGDAYRQIVGRFQKEARS